MFKKTFSAVLALALVLIFAVILTIQTVDSSPAIQLYSWDESAEENETEASGMMVYTEESEIENSEQTIVFAEDILTMEVVQDALVEAMLAAGVTQEYIDNRERTSGYRNMFLGMLDTDEWGQPILPEYTGGIYVHPDSGELVITVVQSEFTRLNNNAGLRNDISVSQFFGLEGVIIQFVEYSYRELEETRDLLVDIMRERDPDLIHFPFMGTGINTELNRISVLVDRDLSEKEIAFFKEFFMDSPMIIFENLMEIMNSRITGSLDISELSNSDSEINADMFTVHPGVRINIPRLGTSANYSLGYRVRRLSDNRVGFITASHGRLRGGDSVNSGIENIGTVAQAVFGDFVDAAFVITNLNITVSNSIPGLALSSTEPIGANRPQMGDQLSIIGANTGRLLFGRVIHENYTLPNLIDGVQFRGLVLTDITTRPGDSGGLVYNWTENVVAGVLMGGFMDSNNAPSYFSRADFISSMLGVRRN